MTAFTESTADCACTCVVAAIKTIAKKYFFIDFTFNKNSCKYGLFISVYKKSQIEQYVGSDFSLSDEVFILNNPIFSTCFVLFVL